MYSFIRKKIIKQLHLILFLFIPELFVFGEYNSKDTTQLRFEIFYEILQPLKLQNAKLYISPEKLLGTSDSIEITFSGVEKFTDTLYAKYPWKFPVHARIEFNFNDRKRISNEFYLDPLRGTWLVNINDTSAFIKPKPRFNFNEKDSLLGIVLLLQTLLQLVIAVLIARIFHWPAWVILVVLVANLASFPVYLLKINPPIFADLLMFIIQFLVILLTGRKRLGIYKIIILITTLTLISFGFKEILIFASKLI